MEPVEKGLPVGWPRVASDLCPSETKSSETGGEHRRRAVAVWKDLVFSTNNPSHSGGGAFTEERRSEARASRRLCLGDRREEWLRTQAEKVQHEADAGPGWGVRGCAPQASPLGEAAGCSNQSALRAGRGHPRLSQKLLEPLGSWGAARASLYQGS